MLAVHHCSDDWSRDWSVHNPVERWFESAPGGLTRVLSLALPGHSLDTSESPPRSNPRLAPRPHLRARPQERGGVCRAPGAGSRTGGACSRPPQPRLSLHRSVRLQRVRGGRGARGGAHCACPEDVLPLARRRHAGRGRRAGVQRARSPPLEGNGLPDRAPPRRRASRLGGSGKGPGTR